MPEFPIHGSKYFDVREFVHPRTWEELKQSAARCEWMIDPKTVRCCDLIRSLSGLPVIVNNWHYWQPKSGKPKYVSSGLRAKWDTTGAAYSQHRLGRAADVKIAGWTPAQIYRLILDNKAAFITAGLTTIEDLESTPTWLHLDCRPRLEGSPEILIIQP